MSGNWQHRILHSDIPPPPDAWSKIADQLEEEYKVGDIMISQKMLDFEISPPPFFFDNVLSALNAEKHASRPARMINFPVRRIAIAAVTIGLIVMTLVYFLGPGISSTTKNSTAKLTPSLPDANTVPPSATDKAGNNKPTPVILDPSLASLSPNPIKRLVQPSYRNTRNGRNVRHKSLNPVLAANASSSISVTAPPIYDDNGNIIMDESLVSAPDENYIIVTSPNGEQTKISRKFLKMLTALNRGKDNSYLNAENFQWKMRFEEWRSKLLQQASYIPTANNFLDIMDLKEMLQDQEN